MSFSRLPVCFAVTALAGLLASAALADEPPEELSSHQQKVDRLLELTGAAEMGHQVMDGMLAQFQQMPQVSSEFIAEFRVVAAEADFMGLVREIYVTNVTETDIDSAIAYWSSPAGQRMAAATPQITTESVAMGQAWGVELAEETMRRLDARGEEMPAQ